MSSRKSKPQRRQAAKLETLGDEQLAAVVAWLLSGCTYRQVRDRVLARFGLKCSLMAVQTIYRRYAAREEEQREIRILRLARLYAQQGGAEQAG